MARTESTNGLRRIGDPRDIVVLEYELEREGVFKFKPIYEALHAYLMEKGFSYPGRSGDENIEDLYWERWVSSGHKEQHIWWRASKDINGYIRYFLQIDYQTLLGNPSDIAHKGKKVSKAEFLDFIVRVKCTLQWDMDNKFKNSLAWKFKKVFFNKMYKDEIDQHQEELHNLGMDLQRMLKSLFEMQADKPYRTQFEPPMGYKEP